MATEKFLMDEKNLMDDVMVSGWRGNPLPKGWIAAPIADFVINRSGNSKLIKGKQHSFPSTGLFQAFSASGADIWTENFEYEGDGIVISAVGARCGKAFFASGKWVAVANTHVVQPIGDAIDTRFLWYVLNNEDFWIKSGSAQPFVVVGKSLIRDYGIPPRSEQTRIVEKLEELLSDLDAGVAELKAAQKKLAQYRQSLLKAAVEGALTAEWRQRQPAEPLESGAALLARILTERRSRWETRQLSKFQAQSKTPPKDWEAKYPEPVAPDTAGLPELPQGWVWSSLGQCFQVAVGATPSRKESGYWSGGIPWVSSGEVRFNRITQTKETITEEGLNNSSTRLNPAGSVLLGMIGEGKTRGQVAILDIEAANNQNCAAIWASETDVPPEYVYFWLWSRYEETRRGSSGNNQPALNKSIVENIPFPLPPLDELQQIVQVVRASLLQISEQEGAVGYSLKQSAAQRKNILQAAFSGQLVPQNPADEPASALLARIRAERAARDSGAGRGCGKGKRAA